MTVLGAVLLAGVLGLSIGSLTTIPALRGDDGWFSSIIRSGLDGHGWEPLPLTGAGPYDGVPDYWDARVGSLPSVVGELVFPMTLTANRGVILLTGVVALAVFWSSIRRLLGGDVALVATAALASTWGFLAMSHWVRWDAMAILAMCAILALLVPGPPSVRSAAIVGGILGIGPDFANSLPAVMPGVLLLCAWERERRWARVGALAGGSVAGLALFFLLHFAPSFDLGQARDQFDLVYRPIGYGEFPLVDAVRELSLEPLLDERDRYTEMMFLQWQTILIALTFGVFASLVMILRELRLPPRWLAIAGVAGLALIAAVPALGSTPHTELRDAIGPMIILAAGLTVVVAIDGLRNRRSYPTKSAPAILLVGLLVGWAVYVGFRTVAYGGYALPFAVAAVASALSSLSPPRLRIAIPAVGLAAATIASSAYLVSEIRAAPAEAALDEAASRRAREIVPPGRTVMGEWIYWWFYKDERFRANTSIWLQAWQHPEDSFAKSFHRICPDYVLLEDAWLSRYDRTETEGKTYPNTAPTDARERGRLKTLLRSEYSIVERLEVDDRTLAFWRRRAADCPQP